MRFIDLFAGLGGFHIGMTNAGHKCVFASELDVELRQLYKRNYGIEAVGDIKKISEKSIPGHDILCAGFPCQPFSKAGSQEGLSDLDRGTLFYDIVRILKYHKPKHFILENVPNLKSHDKGNTWRIIIQVLKNLGYDVKAQKLSPHEYGIPQIRERIFIVGSFQELIGFKWPDKINENKESIFSILDTEPVNAKPLPERERGCLDIWQEFLDRIPKSTKLPSFPIWSMEFGANYPINGKAPYHRTRKDLDDYLGKFGCSLHGMSKRTQLERLPKYARDKQVNYKFPRWKVRFIEQNREFYESYKNEIDPLIPEIQKMPPSWQKFEWNCQGEERTINKLIVQFRGSGIRVKRTNYSPSLVASTSTQIPVITWENRYLTKIEGARLQSLNGIEVPNTDTASFKALGNAVNAKLVELIARELTGGIQSINQIETNNVKMTV